MLQSADLNLGAQMKQSNAKTTVVFYDSDKQFEVALARYLGEVGFSVECPGDPLAALRIVHENAPDCGG